MNSNSTIIRKAAISTGSLTSGLLNPEPRPESSFSRLSTLPTSAALSAMSSVLQRLAKSTRLVLPAVLSVKRQRTQTTAIVQA